MPWQIRAARAIRGWPVLGGLCRLAEEAAVSQMLGERVVHTVQLTSVSQVMREQGLATVDLLKVWFLLTVVWGMSPPY